MVQLDKKLEVWKNKLLDLGKRNRLMNYRDTKRSNLRILMPEIFGLWQSFVVNEDSLEFDYYDDDENIIFDGEGESVETRRVITNQSLKEQQRTLRNLRDKAKIAMEEQGVNILYLSFGFLQWSESNNSEQYFSSPIILVPATLTVESITSPFILSLHEDEIVVNPTLAYKLDNDFGLQIPEFNEEMSLQGYLKIIEELISKNLKWQVIPDVGLSLLSFLKINMYKDLELHKDKIIENSVVRALNGDTAAFNASIEDINDFNHDNETTPTDIFQVVDADSSQQDAILFAKKGASFVLQGPPGTGKSQTITNIIAECLADGKKVLFVSEKMAALEVVQRRLSKAGLDIFCLVLHSYKANKKVILDQLASVLSMTKQKANLSDEAFQKLDLLQEYKERLNEYADAIFTKVSPLGKTIYEVNGYIANLQSYEDVIFKLYDVLAITPQKLNRFVNLLNRFVETVGKKSDDYKFNPWNGANVPAVSNELRHDTGANLGKLIPKIQKVSELYDQMEAELKLAHSSSYIGLHEISDLLGTAFRSPKIPVQWILGDDITPLFSEINDCAQVKEKFGIAQADIIQLLDEIKEKETSFDIGLQSKLFTHEEICLQISALERIVSTNALFIGWQQINDWSKITEAFSVARDKTETLNTLKAGLQSVFETEIFDIDYKSMQARFKTEYTSIFKIFKNQYRGDKKQIQGLYKEIVKKVSDDSIVATLANLRKIDDAKQDLASDFAALKTFFGEAYQAESTDFALLTTQMRIYEKICACLAKLDDLKVVASEIEGKEVELKKHYDYLYNGINTDWNTIHDSLNWASEFRRKAEQYNVEAAFVSYICTDSEKITACRQFHIQLTAYLQDIDVEFTWFLGLFDTHNEIKSIRMPALADRLIACRDGLALLEKWIDFRNVRKECQVEGLTDYLEKIDVMQSSVELIIPMFIKRFYRLWLDAVLPQYPAVMNFSAGRHRKNLFKALPHSILCNLILQKQGYAKSSLMNYPLLNALLQERMKSASLKEKLESKRKLNLSESCLGRYPICS